MIFVFAMLFACLHIATFGQNDMLVLKKASTGKEKSIQEGKRIKVVGLDTKKSRGDLNIINDSVISVGTDTLLINDIGRINYRPPVRFVSGALLTITGGVLSSYGITIIHDTSGTYVNFLAVVFGAPVFVTGMAVFSSGILLMVKGKGYKNGKWNLSVDQHFVEVDVCSPTLTYQSSNSR